MRLTKLSGEINTDSIKIRNSTISINTFNTINIINNPQYETPPSEAGNINVVLRCRPLNRKEKEMNENTCLNFTDSQNITIKSASENNKILKFSFDRVFDSNSCQEEIYESTARDILDSVLQGFNGTILAYGQTSSGKTYTMQGVLSTDTKQEGIVPRLARSLFSLITSSDSKPVQYVIKASIMEIYNEKIRDLIDVTKQNLQIREDKLKGIFVDSLSEHTVDSAQSVLNLIKKGLSNRSVNSTNMNDESSRSHSIVQLTITQNSLNDLSAKTGKLYLVDLAGSEKISKTGATGLVLDEAKMINKSLTTLGHVINSLTDGKGGHVPYRDSKLTRVLQESLGGNAKTCLIVTCSPSSYNEAETISSLRFGLRAKKVTNKARVNKEFSIGELKQKVNNLEGQVGTFKSRVQILEEILMKNGLPLPGEEDSSDDCIHHINNLNEINDVNSLNGLKGLDISPESQKDNVNITPCVNTSILNRTLNEKSVKEINSKYCEVLQIVNELENEKEELKNRLENASERINEIDMEKSLKENMVKELEIMKINSDAKAALMEEKVKKMKRYMEKNRNNLTLISELDITLNNTYLDDSKICARKISNSENAKSNIKINPRTESKIIPFEIIEGVVNIEFEGQNTNKISSGEITTENNKGEMVIVEAEEVLEVSPANQTQTEEPQAITTNNKLVNKSNNSSDNLGIKDNLVLDDFLEKLKAFSNKVPELNSLIDSYKDKLQTGAGNKLTCSNSIEEENTIINTNNINTINTICENNSNTVTSSASKGLPGQRKYTLLNDSNNSEHSSGSSALKTSVINELESKMSKLFSNHKISNTPIQLEKNEFSNWNLKNWKGKFKLTKENSDK